MAIYVQLRIIGQRPATIISIIRQLEGMQAHALRLMRETGVRRVPVLGIAINSWVFYHSMTCWKRW